MVGTYATVTVFDKIEFPENLNKEMWEQLMLSELHDFERNHFGDAWTCGLYHTVEDAKEIVEKNITDIQENCYQYAIIEEYHYGTYPLMHNQWLYKWNSDVGNFLPYSHPFTNAGFQGFSFSRF